MKYLPLIWAALRRRKARTLLTAFSIATAFFLFGALKGIDAGIASVEKLLDVPELLVMSRVRMDAPLPLAHAARIRAVPGVTAVSPMTALVGDYQTPRNVLVVIGMDIPALYAMNRDMKTAPDQLAAMQHTRSGVLIGESLLKERGWRVGERIPLHAFAINGLSGTKKDGSSDWVFDIVGTYTLPQPDWATRILANYDYINDALGAGQNETIGFQVGIADPSKAAQIAQAIDDIFANSPDQTRTQNMKEFMDSTLGQIGNINFLVNGIVGAVLFTLLFLTANTMSQSVRERVNELAVLKTVGFADATVQWLVLAEALVLAAAAAAAGLLLSAWALPRVTNTTALQAQGIGAMHVPASVFGYGLAIAVLLALVSGLPPAQRARRLSIVAALSGR
ncbi:MAG TPA: FtsX-like permease family protein [Steroidobacteraceae bacterium]|nr:FtsX-like permease family protein [Steroidobacteraceae bacterium]